jgi:collagenase-like PrtC family protease
LSELQELYDNGCDTVRIDTFLHNEEWTNEISTVFLKAISLCKARKLTKEFIDESLQNLIKYDKIQSHGFYHMDKNDLIYLVSDESDK